MKKKKLFKILIPILCVLLLAGSFGCYIWYHRQLHESKWMAEGDDAVAAKAYPGVLTELTMMDNTWQTAVPQTRIYELLQAHFDAPLPEGKTAKKAIVIGYDGCRVDTFRLLSTARKSAINLLLNDGGHAAFCYAGGANYPHSLRQNTDTAPGWCSMLTGVLSDVHHITGNLQPKEVEPKSLLLSLPEDGIVKKTAFYTTWSGFFVEKKATYQPELQYIRKNHIKAHFRWGIVDPITRLLTLADLKRKNCSDFIFTVFDYTDHAGHATGFTPENPLYAGCFRDEEAAGEDIINTIRSRKTYDTEDWLILISTDHGGNGCGHGGPSIEERITFIVSNKEILPAQATETTN